MPKAQSGTKKVITVWLTSENEGYSDKKRMFFCFNCRVPIIEYEGDVISMVPGGSPYSPSTALKCKGSVRRKDGDWEFCGNYFVFVGSVQTQRPENTD